MYCHNCGTRNPTGANFCGACGNTLQPADAAETTISFIPEISANETEDVSFPVDEIDDVTVSRRHAEIRREAGEFTIVDSDSLNGTFVNRNRVDQAPLKNGDEIQIGKFKLVIFTEGSKAR